MADDSSDRGATGGDNATRRRFLQTASATAVGGAVLGFGTGTAAAGKGDCGPDNAAAPNDFARVTTRDHYDEDANLINGETKWSYDVEGSWGQWGEELTLFVHGWRSSDEEDEPIDAGQECTNALRAAGYGGETAVFSWDSDTGDSLDLGWSDAKDIAEKNGRKLANFCQWYAGEYGAPVRLIAHSLGGRVVMYALESLEDDYGAQDLLASVSLVGAAVEKDSPSMDAGWFDEEFGDHIEFTVGQLYNFHSENDEILDNIFATRETEEAVGQVGIQYEAPYNYTDFNVTSQIGCHKNYYKEAEGIVDQLVAQW